MRELMDYPRVGDPDRGVNVNAALGIRVGDCVGITQPVIYRVVSMRLYAAGAWWPYVVKLNGWHARWGCDEPCVGLVMKILPWPSSRRDNRMDCYYSNVIRRGGRWYMATIGRDGDRLFPEPKEEVFVVSVGGYEVATQLEMFA